MSLKYEGHSNWKTKYIEMFVNPKTSKSASIGRISILFSSNAIEGILSGGGGAEALVKKRFKKKPDLLK